MKSYEWLCRNLYQLATNLPKCKRVFKIVLLYLIQSCYRSTALFLSGSHPFPTKSTPVRGATHSFFVKLSLVFLSSFRCVGLPVFLCGYLSAYSPHPRGAGWFAVAQPERFPHYLEKCWIVAHQRTRSHCNSHKGWWTLCRAAAALCWAYSVYVQSHLYMKDPFQQESFEMENKVNPLGIPCPSQACFLSHFYIEVDLGSPRRSHSERSPSCESFLWVRLVPLCLLLLHGTVHSQAKDQM